MLLSHRDADTKKDSNTITAGQTKPYYFYGLGLLMGYFIHPFLEQQNNSSTNDEEVYTINSSYPLIIDD